MDPQKFAEAAFNKDSRIRYVGVVDNQYHMLVSQMREGVQSITSEGQDRNFFQIMPPIILDAVEKLQHLLGKVDNVTVRYEKVLVVFWRLKNVVVILTFNSNVSTPFISSLSDTMRLLAQAYLD
jgi:hypothetical protein